jgi:hypothetical protein
MPGRYLLGTGTIGSKQRLVVKAEGYRKTRCSIVRGSTSLVGLMGLLVAPPAQSTS